MKNIISKNLFHLNKKILLLNDSFLLNSKSNMLSIKSFTLLKIQKRNIFNSGDTIVEKDMKKYLENKYKHPDLSGVLQRNEESMRQYENYLNERLKRKQNFNRKNRWQQRELDEIVKNFDIKTAKFKDFAKIAEENSILNNKKFDSVKEIYFWVESLLKKSEFLSEEVISNALDIFIRDFYTFEAEDLNNETFKKFEKQVILGITSYTKESSLIKAAKFFDWFNVENRNCWYNLERVISNKIYTNFSSKALLLILNHFANQQEGSGEFYDLFQYHFWSGKFSTCDVTDVISLGYNLFITDQGYDKFYFDLSKYLMDKADLSKLEVFDLIRIIQIYSNISDIYNDLFLKLEEILLKKMSIITCTEATMIACGFSIANIGTLEFYYNLENIILEEFNTLDSYGIRDVIRAYIIGLNGSDKIFLYVMSEFINNSNINIRENSILDRYNKINNQTAKEEETDEDKKRIKDSINESKNKVNSIEQLEKNRNPDHLQDIKIVTNKLSKFTITELAFITKCFHDKLRKDDNYKNLGIRYSSVEKLFKILEEMLALEIIKAGKDDILIEEILSVCHLYSDIKLISRDFQKMMEQFILYRIKDLRAHQHMIKFLYQIFLESKMCSNELISLLFDNVLK